MFSADCPVCGNQLLPPGLTVQRGTATLAGQRAAGGYDFAFNGSALRARSRDEHA
jgi:hypothetical protein